MNKGPITPQEYINLGFDIIPCNNNTRVPKDSNWQNKQYKAEDFHPGSNIGLRLGNTIDIDFDNQTTNLFMKYLSPCSVSYGKGPRPITHCLFKGTIKKPKKYVLPKGFDKWSKHFENRHENTLIECRTNKNLQSIVPGSIVENKPVFWSVYESLSPYPNPEKIYDEVGKIALATALTIAYPESGKRDDYCFAIAGTLARYTEWTDNQIDEFVLDIAEAAKDEESKQRRKKGTNARAQLEKDGRVFGIPKLIEILNIEPESLYEIFEWVGVEKPNKYLEQLKKDHVYIINSGSMYNLESGLDQKKDEFNQLHLFRFPGGKKEFAFQALMKDFDFQDRIVKGRAVLPGYEYPIATIEKHLYLAPGKYLNLYKGPPFTPIKGDVIPFLDAMKKTYKGWQWPLLEQFFAAVIQKTFKYSLKLTPEQSKEMGNESKIQFGPLIVGPEGTGKKILSWAIQRIIGNDHVDVNASYDQMIEKHSEVILNQLFVFINEVVTTGDISKKVEISNKMKPFWTDPQTKINPKNIRPYRYWNNCNGCMFSNEPDCLHIGKSARRYIVIHQDLSAVELETLEENGTFQRLYDFVKSDKIAHLFHYFLYEVKVENWKIWNGGRAPKTSDLKTMKEDSYHPIIKRLDRALEQKTEPFNLGFVGFTDIDSLLDFVREKWKLTINEKYIATWLKENAFKWKNGNLARQIIHPTKGRPRVYLLEDSDHLRNLSETELGKLVTKDGYENSISSLNHYSVSTDKNKKYKFVKKLLHWYLGPEPKRFYLAIHHIAKILKELIKGENKFNEVLKNSKDPFLDETNASKLCKEILKITNADVEQHLKKVLDKDEK